MHKRSIYLKFPFSLPMRLLISPSAMNVTTRALTPGRSVNIPERILQMVLQMPTMEIRKLALTWEMPLEVARLGRNM